MLLWPVEGEAIRSPLWAQNRGPFLLTSPCHVFVCPLSPSHCPGNKCRPWGSDLSQKEEEDTRERASFWQVAPTAESPLTQTIWGSGETRAFRPLAKKKKGVRQVGVGAQKGATGKTR